MLSRSRKFLPLLLLCCLISCTNYGQLTLIKHLPKSLKEVSAVQKVSNSDLVWMLNDGGNSSKLYAASSEGKIIKELRLNAKNHDWEDLATDSLGNLFIGDFGNNANRRKNLVILKVEQKDLQKGKNAEVSRIRFYFPEQIKFPPKKKQLYFDVESFLSYNDSLYLFTRSRVKGNYGKTSLYKVPASEGLHKAQFISEYTFCTDLKCAITSADIDAEGKQVVLLCSDAIFLLTDFKGDDFLSGSLSTLPFEHKSQKEGVSFKDQTTLYITDERTHGQGGNLYEFKIRI